MSGSGLSVVYWLGRRYRLTLPVILPHGDHLVDNLLGGMALALALLDLLGVAAALDNYSESSQRTGGST